MKRMIRLPGTATLLAGLCFYYPAAYAPMYGQYKYESADQSRTPGALNEGAIT